MSYIQHHQQTYTTVCIDYNVCLIVMLQTPMHTNTLTQLPDNHTTPSISSDYTQSFISQSHIFTHKPKNQLLPTFSPYTIYKLKTTLPLCIDTTCLLQFDK